MTCAYCGKPAEGHFAIHRDGYGVGPDVDLCDACGGQSRPTCGEIWARIAQPAVGECAFRRIPVALATKGVDMATKAERETEPDSAVGAVDSMVKALEDLLDLHRSLYERVKQNEARLASVVAVLDKALEWTRGHRSLSNAEFRALRQELMALTNQQE